MHAGQRMWNLTTFVRGFSLRYISLHQHSTVKINLREEYPFQLLSSTYGLETETPFSCLPFPSVFAGERESENHFVTDEEESDKFSESIYTILLQNMENGSSLASNELLDKSEKLHTLQKLSPGSKRKHWNLRCEKVPWPPPWFNHGRGHEKKNVENLNVFDTGISQRNRSGVNRVQLKRKLFLKIYPKRKSTNHEKLVYRHVNSLTM